MDSLSNNPLLQPLYIRKVLDNIIPDNAQYALTNDVPTIPIDSDTITVDVRQMMGGMTLAVASGAESPIIEKRGVQQWSFMPAQFREKVILGEKDLKALRRLGTASEIETAQNKVAEIVGSLRMRVENRIEWCKWQMIYGSLTIAQPDVQFTIDYKIPSEFKPTLTGGDLWSAGTSKPLDDIMDWLLLFRDEGTDPAYLMYNAAVEKVLLQNEQIRDLRDSLFVGQANPAMLNRENIKQVFSAYAGLETQVYDKGFYFVSTLRTAITNVSTTFDVDDATGIDIGDYVTVIHKNSQVFGRVRILITNKSGNTLTHSAIGGSITYPMGSEVRVKEQFLSDKKFLIRGSVPPGTTGGTNWAEFLATTHVYGVGGIMNPESGIFSKVVVKDDDDPPRVEVIAGVNGLPVLYHPTVNVIATVLS